VEDGILGGIAKEARGDARDGEFVLVAHATGGRQGVVDEREVVEEEGRRERRGSRSESRGNRVDT
jgi:hypothetical protein